MDKSSKIASTTCPLTFAGQSVTLTGLMTPRSAFKEEFVGRVRQAREFSGKSRDEMASQMGVEKEAWIKYEVRTPLPHHLIPKFCRLTGVDIWYLFTGTHASKTLPRPQARRDAR